MMAPVKRRHAFAWKNHALTFGTGGLRILGRLYYPYKLFRSFRVIVKHALSADKTYAKFYTWIRNAFTVAMTRKSNKSRMGKGKGKLLYYMGIVSSGCFFVEVLGPTIQQMRLFLRWIGSKLPVRSYTVICNFTHHLGFSKFAFYKFENIFGISIKYRYRMRPINKLLSQTRRLKEYTPTVLWNGLLSNISPFGANIRVCGYGRCVTLHQKISSNMLARMKYRDLVVKHNYRYYYRKLNTSFFYFLTQQRGFIQQDSTNLLRGIMRTQQETNAIYFMKRMARCTFDYMCLRRVRFSSGAALKRRKQIMTKYVNLAYIV